MESVSVVKKVLNSKLEKFPDGNLWKIGIEGKWKHKKFAKIATKKRRIVANKK